MVDQNSQGIAGNAAVCRICPHHCRLQPGDTGKCGARSNRQGRVASGSYGVITALALDPIEKKPLYHFYPGSRILSAGSFGCNLRCPFCQNSHIAMAGAGAFNGTGAGDMQPGKPGQRAAADRIKPEELVAAALAEKNRGNIGLAYTYNEPLVGYEFVLDCAKLATAAGLKNVLVSNGYVCRQPLEELLPYIQAMNIDLKGFTPEYYAKLGGDLETVKATIKRAAAACHVEVTTLIVPGENDSEAEMMAMAAWLASIDKAIPYHVSRFFPHWQMKDRGPTPVEKVYALAATARRYLTYVYEGNC
ncbi:MAG: AmmeMemoRadiSam system radical SAM enzyme [Clostridiales bacterium]